MKNHMHERKLHNHLGPGGRKCPCCGPNPAYRKQHDRMIKRRIRQHVQREVALESGPADDLRAA